MPEVFPASLKFAHDTQRFECLGLDLNRPVDSVKPGKYPVLTNVRAFVAGRIERDQIRRGDNDIRDRIERTGCYALPAGFGGIHFL